MFYLISNTVESVTYDLGSPAQLTGIMLMTVNSLSNPLMYAMFLPAFRRTIGTLLSSSIRSRSSARGGGASPSSSCAWRTTRRVATMHATNAHSVSGSFSETRTNSTNSYSMAGVQGEATAEPPTGNVTQSGGVASAILEWLREAVAVVRAANLRHVPRNIRVSTKPQWVYVA